MIAANRESAIKGDHRLRRGRRGGAAGRRATGARLVLDESGVGGRCAARRVVVSGFGAVLGMQERE
ncbi:MAG TPA: hypothetical protein PKC43_03640 [Phycisphaerales bacterium]|nr:hypothetical protein [Phycisphaerales bacterium]HMP36519.1 hypothetical protein [Phycisphaerales bacterium]